MSTLTSLGAKIPESIILKRGEHLDIILDFSLFPEDEPMDATALFWRAKLATTIGEKVAESLTVTTLSESQISIFIPIDITLTFPNNAVEFYVSYSPEEGSIYSTNICWGEVSFVGEPT